MNTFTKFSYWILHKCVILSVVVFAVMYASSFLWYKMGMSVAPTMFGYIGIDSNIEVNVPEINKNDLIIAEEYLYNEKPNLYDVVIYKFNDILNVSIVEEVAIDDDGFYTFKVTLNDSEQSIQLYSTDVIGEVKFIVSNAGDVYNIIIHPLTIASFYLLIMFVIVYVKSKKNKINDISEGPSEQNIVNEQQLSNNEFESSSENESANDEDSEVDKDAAINSSVSTETEEESSNELDDNIEADNVDLDVVDSDTFDLQSKSSNEEVFEEIIEINDVLDDTIKIIKTNKEDDASELEDCDIVTDVTLETLLENEEEVTNEEIDRIPTAKKNKKQKSNKGKKSNRTKKKKKKK